MPAELSPAAQTLLGKLCTPHALDHGGHFVHYDSPEETAYYELAAAGLAEVFSLHNYGITARATAAGLALFTGQIAADPRTTAPRKTEEVR
jgi:hypothetical protein